MFGNFAEAIKIVERKKKSTCNLNEYAVLAMLQFELQKELERYEEDYEHWCENQGISDEEMI